MGIYGETLVGGGDPDQVVDIVCKVGEGTVHRLWEPLAEKRKPTTLDSAKFSVPYCIAAAGKFPDALTDELEA